MKTRCELFFSSVNPCGSDPCNPDELCVVKEDSYLCECRMGYQGDCNNCEGKVCNTWLKNEKKRLDDTVLNAEWKYQGAVINIFLIIT